MTAFDLLSFGDTGWGDELLRGALVTLQLSAGGFAAGLLIGTAVALIKLGGPGWCRSLANAYTTLCRSVPEILLIVLLFYAGQSGLDALLIGLGWSERLNISGFAAAIVVLGLVQGAYASEVIRAAILAIPRGQIEAAQAFGFSGFSRLRRITLPALAPHALPGLANLWMIVLKDSALISVVGTVELLNTAKQAAGSTKYYFTFYLAVAVVYYAITLLSNLVVALVEARMRRWMPSGE